MVDSKPILHKGDLITCTNGHVIAEVLDDIFVGTIAWGSRIGNWRQDDHPIPGFTHKPKCAVCGAPFIGEKGWNLHIQGRGWV